MLWLQNKKPSKDKIIQKTKEIYILRCKNCSVTMKSNNVNKRICWKNWQLCGTCAVTQHPEAYCNRTKGIVAGKGYSNAKR